MSQFEVFRNSKEPGRKDYVFLRNIIDHTLFEPVTNSKKGIKFNFIYVRGKSKAKEDARAKVCCPMSWSRDHFNHNNGAFNIDFNNLVGEDKMNFDLRKEWGTLLKDGLKKLSCKEIFKDEAESKDSLKAMLTNLKTYNPAKDPDVLKWWEEAAAKATLKACSKRKRREAARGGEASCSAGPPKISKSLEFFEKFGIRIPPASDYAAVLRVMEAAMEIEERIKEEPKI